MDHDKRGMRIPVSGGAVAPAPGAAIRFDAVVRRQGAFTLGPLDMSVPNGLVTGFVGPNGAGKTTAIKAMLGMVGIDAGSISVLGGAPGARALGGRAPWDRVHHRVRSFCQDSTRLRTASSAVSSEPQMITMRAIAAYIAG